VIKTRGLLKTLSAIATVALLLPTSIGSAKAAEYQEYIAKAKVVEILEEGTAGTAGHESPYQKVKLTFLDGPDKDKTVTLEHGKVYTITRDQTVAVGDTVIITALVTGEETAFSIIDKYRLTPLVWIAGAFAILVVLTAGFKGFGSVIGLVVSLAVIVKLIIPLVLKGTDPLLASMLGALVILFTGMYIAHGFSRKTTLAVGSTFVTLLFTGLLSGLFVRLTHLTGMGSEEAYNLQLSTTSYINLKGLLLGGMIIGALGILDDVTTGLVAAVFELKKANKNLDFVDLVKGARAIGSEHIASLVNTLVMAYAGAAMPLFLLIVLNPTQQPLWSIINNEVIAEEIVRTLAGSIGLVLAVPLTTLIAAWYVDRFQTSKLP
jgi:uncharacterized membrane protein